MESESINKELLDGAAAIAGTFESPTDYFRGLRWQKSFLPDNILCFERNHQVHELSGWEGISEKSGKYDQHGRFVLLFCLEGGGSLGVEQNVLHLHTGDAFLIFPHQLHYYLKIPEKFCWFYVTFELPSEAVAPIAKLRDTPRPMDDECVALLREFMGSYRRTAKGWEVGVALVLRNLLLRLLEQHREPVEEEPESSSNNIVQRTKTYIFSRLDQSFSIADIAKHVGYSESYLRACFKNGVGISLWQFILAAKVSHAAYLLRNTNHRIGMISGECGFDSQLSFARAFKRAFKVSPREYRNKINQSL